jgi:integrase
LTERSLEKAAVFLCPKRRPLLKKDSNALVIKQIKALQTLIDSGTLDGTELARMSKMKRENIEKAVMTRHHNVICQTSRGLWKTKNPQMTCTTRDGLIDKLFDFYYLSNRSLSDLFDEYILWKRDLNVVTAKTLKEHIFLWNRYYRDTVIVNKPIRDLTAKDWIDFFRRLTGNRQMTQQRFVDARSVINGLYQYAIENQIVEANPLSNINYRQFKYKPINGLKKAEISVFTLEERKKLLDYLEPQTDSIYSLAIMFDFHVITRIGELKGYKWSDIDWNNNRLMIQSQLLDVQEMNDDLTFTPCKHVCVDHIKGNTEEGFRYMPLSPEAIRVLRQAKELNPAGEYIFMENGRPMTTCTFNRHLRLACKACGIPNRSSHKIRFTTASALYKAGISPVVIQKLLGHTTLAMTLHYLKDITPDRDVASRMSEILG